MYVQFGAKHETHASFDFETLFNEFIFVYSVFVYSVYLCTAYKKVRKKSGCWTYAFCNVCAHIRNHVHFCFTLFS